MRVPLPTLFSLVNLSVLPFWALMVLAPRWRFTERVMRSWWAVLVPCVVYAAWVVPELPSLLPLLARPELETVAPLLGTPKGAALGWVHFLAFDLFVGRAVLLDSKALGVPAPVVSVILFAVLMVGPLGLLLYLVVRAFFAARATGPAQ